MKESKIQYQFPSLDLLDKVEETCMEFPNLDGNVVSLEHMLHSPEFQSADMELPMALGKTADGKPFIVDLANIPHLLIADDIHDDSIIAIIATLLFTKRPDELQFVILGQNWCLPALQSTIPESFLATTQKNCTRKHSYGDEEMVECVFSIKKLMDQRYGQLKNFNASNIKEYNQMLEKGMLDSERGYTFMPYLVVYISELSDFTTDASSYLEKPLTAIAKLSEKVGIHIIAATSHPVHSVLTSAIKSKFPGRLVRRIWHQEELECILDCKGAQRLEGIGEMYFRMNKNSELVYLKETNVSHNEMERINDFITQQSHSAASYSLPQLSEPTGYLSPWRVDFKRTDPYFLEVARYLLDLQEVNTGDIQRKYCIGYNRASRLMAQLEAANLIEYNENGANPRRVLAHSEEQLSDILDSIYGNVWRKNTPGTLEEK